MTMFGLATIVAICAAATLYFLSEYSGITHTCTTIPRTETQNEKRVCNWRLEKRY